MNRLDFEGHGFKVKVVTRLAVKNFGTPYLPSSLKDFDQIFHKYSSIPRSDELMTY